MKIIIYLSETYHSNAEENLANHNDLKSYRLLTLSALILKYTIRDCSFEIREGADDLRGGL